MELTSILEENDLDYNFYVLLKGKAIQPFIFLPFSSFSFLSEGEQILIERFEVIL